ncbi:MAG: hypothetical protein OES18_23800, partial [Deltaproteobacteria bacterium]|nr:hypothetical protein [Deltaproteobacteria bacterium]
SNCLLFIPKSAIRNTSGVPIYHPRGRWSMFNAAVAPTSLSRFYYNEYGLISSHSLGLAGTILAAY